MSAEAALRDDFVSALRTAEAFDWRDLRSSGDRASAVLEQLAKDPGLLKSMLLHVLDDEKLRSMCERHRPFDKIVLLDGGEKNFRIRLHIWHGTEFERAHQHRFSFTARMLQGRYRHVLYDLGSPAAAVAPSAGALEHPDPDHPDTSSGERLASITPLLEYEMRAGDGYTLHHTAVHATLVETGTVSLILRGPAEKEAAFVANLDAGGVYWRFGRKDESRERIQAKELTRDELGAVITDLTRRGIVA